ncbi:hypothetical protein NA57DRAFT_57006 [Rhizodiscina lignyota]|uniref:Telomere-associated protein Rif1 N-terminal domain-containing protein n=1 Tax=Rhizodiscina lignyota TaxID=1504668 RepID=A0A9P4IEF9_9PEZI|nr:hypothetical protein NA57DRAFT_57006 [Rhizodiscina lignyota]
MVPTRLLDSLQPRPPTPPRNQDEGGIDAALSYLDDSNEIERALKGFAPSQPLDTPQQTPQSSAKPSTTSKSKAKKVDWSPHTKYIPPAEQSRKSAEKRSRLKTLLPSRELKPSKSILKPRQLSASPSSYLPDVSGSPQKPLSTRKFESFAEMLEAVIQALASDLRDYKQDAYITLSGALKTFKDVPDMDALRPKLGLLCRFIIRDMSAADSLTNTPDTIVTTQACKLLLSLMRMPAIDSSLDDDFCSAVLRKSISIAEDESVPKAVTSAFLSLLVEGKFSTRTLTIERASRLLDAIQGIERRVKGNSVIAARILIYKRLVDQVPDLMVLRMQEWLEHLLHGMLSSVADIRSRAIDVATHVGISLGGKPDASRAMVNIFNQEGDDAQSYGDYFCNRLFAIMGGGTQSEAISEPDRSLERDVPKIWAAVVLFLHSQQPGLDRWRYLKPWVGIAQKCFNSSDLETKHQMSIAWNRLVYTVMPTAETSRSIANTLKLPLLPEMSVKGRSKAQKTRRANAFSSYFNLLYYSLRPTASPADWTFYWTQYVATITGHPVTLNTTEGDIASKTLFALFGGFEPRIWNENRAHEMPYLVKVEELPGLDPKWIRQQISEILQLVRLLLSHAPWPESTLESTPVCEMWTALMTAVAEAGSKEIKATKELKSAIANLMTFIHDIWADRKDSLGSEQFIDRFNFLVRVSVQKLGPMHFSDLILNKDKKSRFEVAPTPSQSHKISGSSESPLGHILMLLLTVPDTEDSTKVNALAKALIETCLESKNTKHAQRDFLGGCASTLVRNHEETNHSLVCGIWADLAEMATKSLEESNNSPSVGGTQQLESSYQMLFRVVRAGFQLCTEASYDTARNLIIAFKAAINHELGTGGTTLILADQLHKDIQASMERAPKANLATLALFAAASLESPYLHISLRDVRVAWKKLHGDTSRKRWASDFNPYEQTSITLGLLCKLLYNSFHEINTTSTVLLLSNLKGFLQNMPKQFQVAVSKPLQSGISQWIEDLGQKLEGSDESTRRLRQITSSLHAQLLDIVQSLPSHNSATLASYKDLFVAGFMSHRASIVKKTASAWNLSFGQADSLEYPDTLVRAIGKSQRMQGGHVVEALRLATFPEIPADKYEDVSALDTLSSEPELEDDEPFTIPGPPTLLATKQIHSLSPVPTTHNTALRAYRPVSRSSNATPRSKLRHEDSQIQFEPIHSSPPPAAGDAEESQHLTEHQKEVSERQHIEATTLFSDLNTSSPASILRSPSTRANILPTGGTPTSSSSRMNAKLRSASDDENAGEPERPSTPPLLPDAGMSDDLPGSSPTPSVPSGIGRRGSSSTHIGTPATVRSLVLNESFFDLTSSPPKSSGETDVVPEVEEEADPMIGASENQDDGDETAVDIPDSGAMQESTEDGATQSSAEHNGDQLVDETDIFNGSTQVENTTLEAEAGLDAVPVISPPPHIIQQDQETGCSKYGYKDVAPTELETTGRVTEIKATAEAPNDDNIRDDCSDSPSSMDPELPAAQLAAEYQDYMERRRSQTEPGNEEDSTQEDISHSLPDVDGLSADGDQLRKNPDTVEQDQVERRNKPMSPRSGTHIDVPGTAEENEIEVEKEMSVEEALTVLDSFFGPDPTDNNPQNDETQSEEGLPIISHVSNTQYAGTKRRRAPGEHDEPRKTAKAHRQESPGLREEAELPAKSTSAPAIYHSPWGDFKFFNPNDEGVLDCITVSPRSRGKRKAGRPKKPKSIASSSPRALTLKVKSTFTPESMRKRFSSRLSQVSSSPGPVPAEQPTAVPATLRRSMSGLSVISSQQDVEEQDEETPVENEMHRAETTVLVKDTPGQPLLKKRKINGAGKASPEHGSQHENGQAATRRIFSHVEVESTHTGGVEQHENALETQNSNGPVDGNPAIPGTNEVGAEDGTQGEWASQPTTPRKRKRDSSTAGPHTAEASLDAHADGAGNASDTQTPVQSPRKTPARTPIREILSPVGILKGLRKILSDCKGAMFGTQEEKEIDEVLFHIRREAYEAGRRGRLAYGE